jgi:flagellin
MQAAEGTMEEMTNIAYRMSDLATQSANGTASDADRTAMNAEFSSLGEELGSLMKNTNMGGQQLLNADNGVFASTAGITYQVGSTSAEKLEVDISTEVGAVGAKVLELESHAAFIDAYDKEFDVASNAANALGKGQDAAVAAGVSAADSIIDDFASKSAMDTAQKDGGLSLSTQDGANNAITTLAGFIDDVGSARSGLGANINRLDHTMANLGNMSENTAAAKSRIMDTDMAAESSRMSKNQMLMQAGAQVLSSTKMVPQLAMSLMG